MSIFRLADLRALQLGGFADNMALTAMAAGAGLTHPALGLPYPLAIAGSTLAAMGGGAWIARRLQQRLPFQTIEGQAGSLRINSSKPPPPTPDGIHLGYIVDTGEPLVIPLSEWMRHAMIVGQSGVGKTVLGTWIMAQQIQRGGGLLWIDGKLDPDNIAMLWQACAWAGRLDDLRIISPDQPDSSNTYNPILYGDAYEVASRCVSLIPSTENSPGADYYRQEANQAVTTLIAAIQARGLTYNFADLSVLLSNGNALLDLEASLPHGSAARLDFTLFLSRFKTAARGDAPPGIDLKRLRDTLSGISGRFHSFGTGNFGQVMNSYSPEVRLKDDILANRIIYVALPTMGKAEAAAQVGKLIIGDFRSAIANVQALPKEKRPWPPFIGFFDECGSYVTQAWSRMFEQARSAHLMMIPAFQTKANLETLGEELRAMVSGNTLTKVFFKPGEPDTAEWMSEMIGEEYRTQYSVSVSQGTSQARDSHLTKKPAGWNVSGGVSFSESQQLAQKITPSELMQLGKGEAIISFDGSNIYHIRVPLIEFDRSLLPVVPKMVNRLRTPYVKGLDLYRKIPDLARQAAGGRE